MLYFTNFLQDNVKNLKITQKGITKIISLKHANCISPNTIIDDDAILADPTAIDNDFNNFFSIITFDIFC